MKQLLDHTNHQPCTLLVPILVYKLVHCNQNRSSFQRLVIVNKFESQFKAKSGSQPNATSTD